LEESSSDNRLPAKCQECIKSSKPFIHALYRKRTGRPGPFIACVLLAGFAVLLMPSQVIFAVNSNKKECVILLHGLFRTSSSMAKLERALSRKGYFTLNVNYPSTKGTIRELTEKVLPEAVSRCVARGCTKIHMVTHSMGGIMARYYLQKETLPEGSRLVMIAPPNQGSEIVDRFKDFFIFKWMNGPAGQELTTSVNSLPNRLGPVPLEVGVIAGKRSLNPIFSALIPGPDDGKVSVERTRLSEMADFFVANSSHTFIMKNDEVIRQVTLFIENGRFDHSGRPKNP
jgi:triacylglycerol lipase